jgi:type II secretion system protein H
VKRAGTVAAARLAPLRAAECGYTLVELLVVIVVIGIMLSLVSLSIVPNPTARLHRDAERLEALFALAAEEAQLSSQPITWRGDEHGYGFYRRVGEEWTPVASDGEFKLRAWDVSPMRLTLVASDVSRWATDRAGRSGLGAGDDGTAIAFPRDGLQVAFDLKLEADGRAVLLRSDGGGHYWVEDGA